MLLSHPARCLLNDILDNPPNLSGYRLVPENGDIGVIALDELKNSGVITKTISTYGRTMALIPLCAATDQPRATCGCNNCKGD